MSTLRIILFFKAFFQLGLLWEKKRFFQQSMFITRTNILEILHTKWPLKHVELFLPNQEKIDLWFQGRNGQKNPMQTKWKKKLKKRGKSSDYIVACLTIVKVETFRGKWSGFLDIPKLSQ